MQLYHVTQKLVSNPLKDIEGALVEQLNALDINIPSGDIAITAGSRGIANIPLITRVTGEWLKTRGGNPFLVPCMGSHNGATAEGQREIVETLGMTEEETGMPIRAGMDVVKIGTVSSGDVYMDKHCYNAAGVVVINRIKLHTCFSGPVQSGLTKMMVVGMGKIESARTFHAAPVRKMKDMLMEMGRMIQDSGRIIAGIAILEDGLDQTAEIHVIRGNEILMKEPSLLERHKKYFPRLPVEDINVLVIDEIGKTYSGTGMDTNVIGYRGVKGGEDLDKPSIRIIAAMGLCKESHGNAIGVGLADFITKRLRDEIDERKTFINVFTTGEPARGKIPLTFETDEELVTSLEGKYGRKRWMFIPNTLRLDSMFVSGDLIAEIGADAGCVVDPVPVDLVFAGGRYNLTF